MTRPAPAPVLLLDDLNGVSGCTAVDPVRHERRSTGLGAVQRRERLVEQTAELFALIRTGNSEP